MKMKKEYTHLHKRSTQAPFLFKKKRKNLNATMPQMTNKVMPSSSLAARGKRMYSCTPQNLCTPAAADLAS